MATFALISSGWVIYSYRIMFVNGTRTGDTGSVFLKIVYSYFALTSQSI